MLVASYTRSPHARVELPFPTRPIDTQIRPELLAGSARPASGSANWVALLLGVDATAWEDLLGLSLAVGLNHSYWDISSDLSFPLSSKESSLALEATLRVQIFERDRLSMFVGGGAQAKLSVNPPWVESSGVLLHGLLGLGYDLTRARP